MTLEKFLKHRKRKNKRFLLLSIILWGCLLLLCGCDPKNEEHPNIIFVFADQWRAQDVDYNENDVVQTPTIDRLAEESVVFANAVSGCPVCCPYRPVSDNK